MLKKSNNMFTPEEVKAAKQTRDAIIKEGTPEMKALYMAGEIVMWDQLQSQDSSSNSEKADEVKPPLSFNEWLDKKFHSGNLPSDKSISILYREFQKEIGAE